MNISSAYRMKLRKSEIYEEGKGLMDKPLTQALATMLQLLVRRTEITTGKIPL